MGDNPQPGAGPVNVAVFLFDGAEELDWAGPWEVLSSWAQLFPGEANAFTVARRSGSVTCAKGLVVVPEYSWETSPVIDVLVYPGGQGMMTHLKDEQIHFWLAGLGDAGALMTSVCTGSLVYASAGLLDGRPATTHWASIEQLAAMGRGIEVKSGERFIDSGSVVTAAGVSAGIDMALHLIKRLKSHERAAAIRRYIEYDPSPPV